MKNLTLEIAAYHDGNEYLVYKRDFDTFDALIRCTERLCKSMCVTFTILENKDIGYDGPIFIEMPKFKPQYSC